MRRGRADTPAQVVEQQGAGVAAEPSGVAEEVAVVGEIGVRRRIDDHPEVLHLGKGVLEVSDRQDGDEARNVVLVERRDLLVSVDEGVHGLEIRLVAPGAGQVEPVDRVALDGDGEVVHREGAIRQAEVEDAGNFRRRPVRSPGEVRGMPVAVGPLGPEQSQRRPCAPDPRQQDLFEVRHQGSVGHRSRKAGPCTKKAVERSRRVRRRHDGRGRHQDGRSTRWQGKLRRGAVQLRQGAAGCPGMTEPEERRPRDGIAVQVEATRELLHLVHEVADARHRGPTRSAQEQGHGLAAPPQPFGEGVLGLELFGGADRPVVTLHEDRTATVADDGCRRHRSRARPHHLGRGITPNPPGVEECPEHGRKLVGRERRPVRLDELLAHSVHETTSCRRGPGLAHVRASVPSTAGRACRRVMRRPMPPSASVSTALTAKEQIDADIQLSALKPIKWPNFVHAVTHQEM